MKGGGGGGGGGGLMSSICYMFSDSPSHVHVNQPSLWCLSFLRADHEI